MSDNFGQAYENLLSFIRDNSEIEIQESVTSIPEDVRTEFYLRFNAARATFIEHKFPDLLNRANELRQHYAEAEQSLFGCISWEESPEASRIQRFLRNVSDSMIRELYDPLFDLLKGKETIDGFEQAGAAKIASVWPNLFQGGYEKWVVLSLVKLLSPDRILRVDARTLKQGERAKSAAYAPWDDVPIPQESAAFYFTQPRNTILAAPDFIIQSAKINRFVGIRSEFADGLYKGLNPSQAREWLPLDSEILSLLGNGPTLVYLADDPQQIAMIADVTRFCRPDLILWCINTREMEKTRTLELLVRADDRIAPRIGSMGILTEPWAGLMPDSRIRFLEVGFDATQLQEIVRVLLAAESPIVNEQS